MSSERQWISIPAGDRIDTKKFLRIEFYFLREDLMLRVARVGLMLAAVTIAASGMAAQARQASNPKQTDLPNPDRLGEGWPTPPKNMNGGRCGEVIRVRLARYGNNWVIHR